MQGTRDCKAIIEVGIHPTPSYFLAWAGVPWLAGFFRCSDPKNAEEKPWSADFAQLLLCGMVYYCRGST
jgi:hypothetical protein